MNTRKVIHRDLKPENILLKSKENDHEVIIADFGLSTRIGKIDKIIFKRCGTPGFVAPEVLTWGKGYDFYDYKCDVYSIGVIFHILLTGK